MTTDCSTTTAVADDVLPSVLPPSVRHHIFLYLGILIVLLAFGGPSGGLIDIPISFLLKNRLHLTSHEVANFRLVAAIPLYLSFVFGFVRDMWNPFGLRDRGFMLLFGGIGALLYAAFALAPMSYATLLAATIVLTAAYLFVASAQTGMTSAHRPAACDERPGQRGLERVPVDPDSGGAAAGRRAQRLARGQSGR